MALIDKYITHIIYCISVKQEYIIIEIEGYGLSMYLIHTENDKYIYYTNCYIKINHIPVMIYHHGNDYLNETDINYNHSHDVSDIFHPFDSENTYSITNQNQKYGRYAVTLYVEKLYYKYWLIKSLPIDIDVINLIQNQLYIL